MALTRKFLSALGIEPDKIDEIIEAHAETVNGLKGERDGFKESADKLVEVQNKLKEAEKQIEGYGKDGYKSKYDELQSEYKAYKESIEKEKLTANKSEAYKAMLKEAGVSEKRLGAIVKLTDLSNVELDGDKLKDADKLMESAKKEWAEFIVDTHSEGADTPTPPSGDGKTPKTIPQIF